MNIVGTLRTQVSPQMKSSWPVSVVYMRELMSTNFTNVLLVPNMQKLMSFQTIVAWKCSMTSMTLVRVHLWITEATESVSELFPPYNLLCSVENCCGPYRLMWGTWYSNLILSNNISEKELTDRVYEYVSIDHKLIVPLCILSLKK